jgi:glycosyltransferase involved in cell wall biosynthesis
MKNNIPPLVSIAIPTYNRANSFLKESLKSAINQTYENIEIIISDNCSTDNTEAVVSSFNDKRISYFRQTVNIGAANNSNFCLRQAKGVYFTQLHDDDLIDPDFLDVCLKTLNYTFVDIGVIRTGTRWIDKDGLLLGEKQNFVGGFSAGDFFAAYCGFKASIYLCSTVFNTNRLKEIGGFHSKYNLFEDIMAVAKLSAKYGRKDIQECKASTRKHPDEITFSTKVEDWCEESTILLDTMCELVPDKAAELRIKGRNFVFVHNYNLAKKIEGFSERFAAYVVICKTCGYMYSLKRLMSASPLYRSVSSLYRLMRSVQRKLRAVW